MNDNTTTLCNDTKGERTFWLRPPCSANGSTLAAQLPSHTFSALTVSFNGSVLWNKAIAVLLPSAVENVRLSFVYSTIVECDGAPCPQLHWHVHPLHVRMCFVMHIQIILQMYSWHPTYLCINICNTHVHIHTFTYSFCIMVWCNMTVLQHFLLSLLSGATLHSSELLRVAVSL